MELTQEVLKKTLDATIEKGVAVVVAWTGNGPLEGFQPPLRDRFWGFVPIGLDTPEWKSGRQFLRALLARYFEPARIPDHWEDWLVMQSRGRVRTLQALVARLQFECRIKHLSLEEADLTDLADFGASLKAFLVGSLPD
jgi:chromosomal replication initiation ATPase DnaA